MANTHNYAAKIVWTGDLGSGTSGYKAYSREHQIIMEGKADIAGSADHAFRGDSNLHKPEDMMVAALSACHMLWYLHLCSQAGIIITAYQDEAAGEMVMDTDGGGHFSTVTLRPNVTISAGDRSEALRIHKIAHEKCFIARSVNFPVHHEPTISVTA